MLQMLISLCWYWGWAVGILFVGEWLARRLTPQKEVLPRGLFSNHPLLGYVFTPGFSGRSNCGIQYSINSLGLRDCERNYLAPSQGARILAVGNSFAMGAGEPFEDTFLVKLEEELRFSRADTEVVKAGIGGYGTRHELSYYREFGRRYNPQVVLVLFFIGTDFRNNMTERRGHVRNGKLVPSYPYSRMNRFMKYLETRSGLYNALLYGLRYNDTVRGALHRLGLIRCAYPQHVSMYQKSYDTQQCLALEKTLASLDDFKSTCKEDGSQLVLCVVPDRLQVEDVYFKRYIDWLGEKPQDFDVEKPNRLLAEYCQAQDIYYCDLLDDFRHLHSTGEQVYLSHDIHWDDCGRKVAAQRVSHYLQKIVGVGESRRESTV